MRMFMVIPAYNEERTIGRVVKELIAYGPVLVANDCSTDHTARIAEESGAIVVSAEKNGGYDATVNLGFRKAVELGASHIITFDADGQHPAHQIPEFLRAFEMGAAAVVGVRPKMQRFSESIFSVFYRMRFGVSDPLTGMKGYDLRFYGRIGFFDSVRSIGTELLTRYLILGLAVKQIHIEVREREDESRFGGAFRANFKILSALGRVIRIN